MFPQTLLALLTDRSDRLLLVRRKGSVLWTLPGGQPRGPVASRSAFLTACCSRQIGVAPDFVGPFQEFVFVGDRIAVATDEIIAEQVRACGRIDASSWHAFNALPVELAPVACMAIALHARARIEQALAKPSSGSPDTSAPVR